MVDVLDLLTDEIVEELNNLGGGWPYGFPFGDFLECLLVQTRAYKRPARVATTGPIIRLGIPVIDGVPLSAGDSVLVKNQIDSRENGLYVVSAGIWSRRDDADDDGDIVGGMVVPVAEGALNQGVWQQTTADPIFIGTSAILFQKIGPASVGTGPIKSGRLFPGSFAGNPKKAAVVFGTAFSTTDYAVTLTAEGTANKQFFPTYENKLTTGFTINLGTNNLANLVEVSWHAIVAGS